jgi:hypothetical protein
MAEDASTDSNSKYWLDRAAKCRAQADRMKNPVAKKMMGEVAATYEHWGRRADILKAEKRAK